MGSNGANSVRDTLGFSCSKIANGESASWIVMMRAGTLITRTSFTFVIYQHGQTLRNEDLREHLLVFLFRV